MRRPKGVDLSNWRQHPHSQWSFQHTREVVPTAAIPAPQGSPRENLDVNLERYQQLVFGDRKQNLEAVLETTHSDALLISQHGKPVAGWFAPYFEIPRPHLLFSVSKSITAMVAGIMTDAGKLDPQAPVGHYIDVAADSAYADCTVQHVLDMSVALDFNEDYEIGAPDYTRYRKASGWNPVDQTQPVEGLRSLVPALPRLQSDHGEMFRYRSPNSDLLGMILESAADQSFAILMSELLWMPMGAASDAYITVDHYGAPRTAGGICITVEDLNRLGQLIANRGKSEDGRQILSREWIEDTCRGGNPDAWSRGDMAEMFPGGGYRNKWYQTGYGDDQVCAIGIHGQFLYVDARRNIVISRLASQPKPVDDPVDGLILEVMKKIAEQSD